MPVCARGMRKRRVGEAGCGEGDTWGRGTLPPLEQPPPPVAMQLCAGEDATRAHGPTKALKRDYGSHSYYSLNVKFKLNGKYVITCKIIKGLQRLLYNI